MRVKFVPITLLTEGQVRRMGDLRYLSLPTLSGRSAEDDLVRFQRILRDYLFAGLVLDAQGEIGGFLLFGTHLREWKGRHWLWVHAEDAAFDPRFRGGHALERMALRVTLGTRLRNPMIPMYGLTPLFPPSYLKVRGLGPAWAWGDPAVPEWQRGLLDYMAEEIATDHVLDRERHVVQLHVTSGSRVPVLFRSRAHRDWFSEYERFAPEWREGRVPIFLYPFSLLAILRTGLVREWRQLTGGAPAPAARLTVLGRDQDPP